MIIKSVKSINPLKSVIQAINDTLTKGYGGALRVESKRGKGIKFILKLPIS